MSERGFTLIELLIVIGIVAILSVIVILTLNPTELLKQARDSNRISDMATLKSAISLYLADISTVNLATTTCYMSSATNGTSTARCGYFSATGGVTTNGTSTVTNNRKIDGTGWIPVNFSQISTGAPIGQLPVDPLNNSSFYYAYAASSTSIFELDANLESAKYATNESSDGGDNNGVYEAGTAPGLAL